MPRRRLAAPAPLRAQLHRRIQRTRQRRFPVPSGELARFRTRLLARRVPVLSARSGRRRCSAAAPALRPERLAEREVRRAAAARPRASVPLQPRVGAASAVQSFALRVVAAMAVAAAARSGRSDSRARTSARSSGAAFAPARNARWRCRQVDRSRAGRR
jgi:hypothetical protein